MDVEPLTVWRPERCLATRESLAADALAQWQKAMAFEGPGPGLPPMMDGQNRRRLLGLAQLQDRNLAEIIRQKQGEADPARGSGELLGEPALQRRLKPQESAQFHLAPKDKLLERRMASLSDGCRSRPMIPDGEVDREPGLTWKRWLFDCSHLAPTHSHRAQGESFQLLRRVGWWDRLSADFNVFYVGLFYGPTMQSETRRRAVKV